MNLSKLGSLKILRYNSKELLNVCKVELGFIKLKLILFPSLYMLCNYKVLSKEQRERRAKNIYNHRMSKKGYAGLAEEMVGLIMRIFFMILSMQRY